MGGQIETDVVGLLRRERASSRKSALPKYSLVFVNAENL